MAVAFTELNGSPTINIGPQGFSGTRRFRIAWADWNAFAAELIGGWISVSGKYHLLNPKKFPGVPNVFIESIDIVPFDPTAPDGAGEVTSITRGLNEYTSGGALVVARYKTLEQRKNNDSSEPSVPDGTILNYSATSSTETISTASRAWEWSNGDDMEEDVRPPRRVPAIVHRLEWSRVAAPPWAAIRDAHGKTNNASFLGADIDTLLFDNFSVTREFQFSREEEGNFWTITYEFIETSKKSGATHQTHNHIWRPYDGTNGGDWDKPTIKGASTTTIYESVDFTTLFAFG